MNIAMFTDSYKPQINGLVTSIDIFSKYLRKKGHIVYIFAPESKGEKEKFVFRFKSISFQMYRGYRIGIPYKILLNPEIKKIKFDVVHVHSPFSMGAAGLGFAKYYKIPVVGTFHTLFPDYMHYAIRLKKLQDSEIIRKLFHRTSWSYLSWFYNRCNVVISPSEKIRCVLSKNGIKKKIVVLPTGIETKIRKKNRDIRKKYCIGDSKIILHVGRISREKNIRFIIDSLKPLLENKNVKFVITSGGPYKNELEKYVNRLRLGNKIIFTGFLLTEELNSFYSLSDIFVLASETETQGIVLAEAAINKLPMVVLDAPVTSDFVMENNVGIVSDRKSFAKNVELLLNNKKLKEKCIKNSEKIKRKYDIENCTNRLLEIYRDAQKLTNKNNC